MSTPILAVVGHPNKGKSSIVSALTEQEQVAISEISGTTVEAQGFDFKIDNKLLYTLVDTPGFQRPRQVLEILEKLQPNASQRINAIQQFLEHYAEDERFQSELQLLNPILNGASIIYVVDGSVPYSQEYEAEMSILQWTGQARMALINPIAGDDYVQQWQQALSQFFSLVQVFNPMLGQAEQRKKVLKALAVLKPEWQSALEAAQQHIEQKQKSLEEQSANLIAAYLKSVLSYSLALPFNDPLSEEAIRRGLQERYQLLLKEKEGQLQKHLLALYSHHALQTDIADIELDFPELFDRNHWYIFGLSRKKLIMLSSAAGLATGAMVDLGLGGGTFMTGALIGGIGSAAASAFASEQPDKIKISKLPLGGEQLQIGPVHNMAFAFNLLGRALHFYKTLRDYSHANRNTLSLSDVKPEWINALSTREQVRLTKLLKSATSGLTQSEQTDLCQLIAEISRSALR